MQTDRQIVAAAFRGRLSKPARDMSPSYVARLAREVRAARAEGRRPERQAGRGHKSREIAPGIRSAREHPAQFVVREVDGRRQRVPIRGAQPAKRGGKPTPAGVIVQREYVDIDAAERWLHGLPADVAVQVVGHGVLLAEYGSIDAAPDDEPTDDDPDVDDDTDAEPTPDADDEPERSWRSVYTGNAAGDPDLNDVSMAETGDLRAALDRVFVPGSVDIVIIRWQR